MHRISIATTLTALDVGGVQLQAASVAGQGQHGGAVGGLAGGVVEDHVQADRERLGGVWGCERNSMQQINRLKGGQISAPPKYEL